MSNHPINLTIHFLLELAALGAMAYWGLTAHQGMLGLAWGLGLVVVASLVWGVFRIEGEPGHAPVPVHGLVRLLIEAVFFGSAVWLLSLTGAVTAALIFAVIVVVHYATSYDRILRMVRNEKPLPVDWSNLKM